MKADELRNMSLDELKMRVRDSKADLFKFTNQLESRQSEDTSKRLLIKREIARILTVISEKIKKGDVTGQGEVEKVEKVVKQKKEAKPTAKKEQKKEIEPSGELRDEKKTKTKKEVKPEKRKRLEKKTRSVKVSKTKKK